MPKFQWFPIQVTLGAISRLVFCCVRMSGEPSRTLRSGPVFNRKSSRIPKSRSRKQAQRKAQSLDNLVEALVKLDSFSIEAQVEADKMDDNAEF